jgi:adenylate cyclase
VSKIQQTAANKVARPIGAKLVIIITFLLLVSLGAITVLVSVMVSSDVRITAEENNLTVNRRSSQEAENTLTMIRSNTLVLLDTLNAAGFGASLSRQASNFFFERNQDIAAVALLNPEGGGSQAPLINDRFFVANELDDGLVDSFIAANGDAVLSAAAGEVLILNAAPFFGLPLLAMLCPWDAEGRPQAALSLFSTESLSDAFGSGINSSWMINGADDLLVHPDGELVMAAVNTAGEEFTGLLRASAEQSFQVLYTGEDGTRRFGAFTKLSLGGAAVITVINYDIVFEGVVATTRRNIFLSAAVLSFAVLFIWFFSKSISNPLKLLNAAAEKIESGHFEVALKGQADNKKDEIGVLTDSFGKMSKALSIFGRFTNRDIAVKAMRGEIRPGGEPKTATIFFSDIRGFTAHSENITNEFGAGASDQIVAWLNEYFTRMVACVTGTNGAVDKFIGDAVMAHWGTAFTAGSPEEDAFNCVKAALMMRSALLEMNNSRGENDQGFPKIKIGCGINTGLVTAGQIGSDERMEYTVIGDPVNLASRTESLNKPMGTDILITENTWTLIRDRIITEEMPPVTVKGKAEPVRLFAVVNVKDAGGSGDPSGPQGPQSLAEVRALLGVEAPDLSKVDTGAEEKKYKIGSE